MKRITLKWLLENGACLPSIRKFKEIFGEKARVSPKRILSALKNINNEEWEAWLLAQNIELTKELLDNGANINAYDSYALGFAAESGDSGLVEFLLVNGADVNADGGWPLYIAVNKKHKDVVEILLKKRADINVSNYRADNETLLNDAIAHGNQEIVELLKKYMDKDN